MIFIHTILVAFAISCSISIAQEKEKREQEPVRQTIRSRVEVLPKGVFALVFEQNLGAPAETAKSIFHDGDKTFNLREEKWYIQNTKMVDGKTLDKSAPYCMIHRISNVATTQPGILRMDRYSLTTRVDDSRRVSAPPNPAILHRMVIIGGTNDDRIYYHLIVQNQSEDVPRGQLAQLLTSARDFLGLTYAGP